jgi:hypothetical protein
VLDSSGEADAGMRALAYWKTVTTDHAGFLDSIMAML